MNYSSKITQMKRMFPYFLTVVAMLAFAANSVLGRLALIPDNGEASIDAASYTSVRLLSGAVMLAIIMLIRTGEFRPSNINPISTLMLFIYAICFSFSYINIATGTGALILFGTVQLTMMLSGLFKGERPGYLALIGILLALGGLIYLLSPGVTAPPFTSALLMMFAGLAWGIYSVRGKDVSNPLVSTAWNFIATLPLILITLIFFHAETFITHKGIILAMISGALASGLGYSVWYYVLPSLSSTGAATVQLTVPVIASTGGVIFLSEELSMRLLFASIAVLGGVYLTIKPVRK